MNILIFNESFYPSIGGVERFVDTLAGYLHNLGVGVSVITNTEPDPSQETEYPYVVYRRPASNIIKELIAKSDIVHLNSFDPYIYCYSLLKRKKIVFTFHDLSPICPKSNKFKDGKPCVQNARPVLCYKCLKQSGLNSKIKKLFRPIIKSTLSILNSANVVLSRYQFDKFKLYNKCKISLGVDTELFKPRKKETSNDVSTVIFAGRLIKEKGC
ncbi:MAG: glycosyltransferase, partial [Nitrosopumilaceae archaeon]|nr:glycosyltransferase [Nitrosopumilaceae archaeon]